MGDRNWVGLRRKRYGGWKLRKGGHRVDDVCPFFLDGGHLAPDPQRELIRQLTRSQGDGGENGADSDGVMDDTKLREREARG
jgi:hypothetical protein